MRVLLLFVLLLAPSLAGCGAPDEPGAPEVARLGMLALDGRWPFDAAEAEAFLARASVPPPGGALVLAEAMAARTIADVAGFDTAAGTTMGLAPPSLGEAYVTRGWAAREGVSEGDALTLRSHAWPAPYVATYFEMERTRPCAGAASAKLCFLPTLVDGEARLRLRVDTGARDAAFLPDVVELGPGGRPAWWNGSFISPSGNETLFSASAAQTGALVPAEFEGAMEPGEWTIAFRLEVRGELAPAGAAGIVRVREPGYLWFDDRLQLTDDPNAQARSVLANGTPTRVELRIARVIDDAPIAADVVLALDDARVLTGTSAGVSALLVNLTPSQERALDGARGPDGMTLALRARPLPEGRAREPAHGDLVFAVGSDADITRLAPVEGARAVSLALAGRAPVGEDAELDGDRARGDLLLLAHAEGDVPWTLPAGGRWTQTHDALDNLSRSRTLALASADLLLAPIATARVELGSGNTTRSLVAIGGVVGGPDNALWTSAALVSGAGRPVNPRLVVTLEDGADREDVARRALDAWRDAGAVRDR